jgi:CheY-like chemotaxis protein
MSINSPPTLVRRPVILVVDDEIDITETYAMLLELHDFTVVTASNGADALAKVKQAMPDLIVSDCMMPVMNGIDFCIALRALPGGGQVPVILCSGAPEAHELSRARHDIFLRKPIFFEQLLEHIQKLL